MDLRHYLATLARRKWQILTVTLLTVFVASFATLFIVETRYEATLYFTISARDDKITDYYDFSNYYGNMAAIEFTRTISGWHENPKFQEEIYNKAGINVNKDLSFLRKLIGPFSVKRIERANVKVRMNSKTLEGAERLTQAYADVMEERLEHYNQISDSKYSMVEADRTLYAKEPKLGTNIFLAILIGLILSVILAYLYEYFARIVASKDQAEKILDQEACEILPRKFSFQDLGLLKSYIDKLNNKTVILAGLSFDSSKLSSKLALRLMNDKKAHLLIDADLEKHNLHGNFKESRRLKKGYTDSVEGKMLEKLIQEIEKKKLYLLPAGKGDSFPENLFGKLQSIRKFTKLLIHTTLPRNIEVLNLVENSDLLLIVKLGESKTDDLQKVREFLAGKKIHLVIIQ